MPRNTGRNGNSRPDFDLVVSDDVTNAIEKRPHSMYIKYLMTKRCGISFIINELQKLGLSAPSNDFLVEYYNLRVDPLIKKNKLTKVYADYKSKINGRRKNGSRSNYNADILNYRKDIGVGSAVLQANFCKFIKELGAESPWMWEITRFYKSVDNFPKDENGIRILSGNNTKTQLNKIASSKNRAVYERLLLENVSVRAITRYAKETLKETISEPDVALFKEVFFNTKLNGIEENINILENELRSQMDLLKSIKNSSHQFATMSVGDRSAMERQVTQRVNELDDNLRNLKASHSDLTYNTKAVATNNTRELFLDVLKRSYKKFCSYDQSNDRDIATAMARVAGIMSQAQDKIDRMDDTERRRSDATDDMGVRENLAALQQERLDEIEEEEKQRASAALKEAGLPELDNELDLNEIGGVDELGLDFSNEDGQDDKKND